MALILSGFDQSDRAGEVACLAGATNTPAEPVVRCLGSLKGVLQDVARKRVSSVQRCGSAEPI